MDILGEYEKQHPAAPTPVRTLSPQQAEYGFFVRLVMRLSGGKIRNSRQASYVLLAAVVVVFLISLLLFFGIPGTGQKTKPLDPRIHPGIPTQ